MPPSLRSTLPADRFRHEALFYDGMDGFLSGVGPFVEEGLGAGEQVLVVVSAAKIDRLRRRLGDRPSVRFADMNEVGVNPARIIPAWREFVDEHTTAGRTVRGVGEPIWAERTGDELAECHLHEALLNLAFGDGPGWQLLCPYDTLSLEPGVLHEARHTHPYVWDGSGRTRSTAYPSDAPTLEGGLPDPPGEPAVILEFDRDSLRFVRQLVAEQAHRVLRDDDREHEVILAVNEIATNSVRHGGGRGRLRMWRFGSSLICEVLDRGWVRDPLVGRRMPDLGQVGGRGLWMVNQLSDLVQLRSTAEGTAVRIHVAA